MLLSSYFQQFFHAFSFKRCSLFLFIFVFAITLILVSTALIIIFILKPHQPNFSLQTIKLESYKLDISNSTLFVSSAVISLTLIAQNPNKFGLRYSPTVLHVFYQRLAIGMINVPEFYQPPHSMDLTFETRALLYCVNVSEILSGISRKSRNDSFGASIVGDVVAEVRLLRVCLPKIKFALECNMSIDQSYFMYSFEALQSGKAVKNHTISLPINSQGFSKECSVAIYI